ncbi:tereporin-Ca1-like [Argopecten irradians]|uniref:tereporin-Ca1-like n=1 Tax=Argopecten irradians TaxID=31199 RepID=UPI00370F99FD
MFAGLAAAISAGSSLAGTTICAMTANVDLSVACGIETSNWTKYVLEKPIAYNDGERIKIPPSEILPGVKEAMLAHKTPICATGTYGTVSWIIKDRRVVVMWDAPFDFNIHDNWLAVDLTKEHDTNHCQSFYDTMYNKSSTSTIKFSRNNFAKTIQPVKCSDDEFEVVGSMGTSHKPTVEIVVRPINKEDYAPSLRKALDMQ